MDMFEDDLYEKMHDVIKEELEYNKECIRRTWLECSLKFEEKLVSQLSCAAEWGRYGWTVAPDATIDDYATIPLSQEEADNQLSPKSLSESVSTIFKELKNSKCLNQDDIDELITLYEKGFFKSCAMLLFSLIESLLINRNPHNTVGTTASTGKRAFSEATNTINRDARSFLAFNLSTCETAFGKVWERIDWGDDSETINRHLLMHGLYLHKVEKTDCIKLLLLYDNLLYCFNEL